MARSFHLAANYEMLGAMLDGLGVQVATLSFGSREACSAALRIGNVALESLSAGLVVRHYEYGHVARRPADQRISGLVVRHYEEVMNYSEASSLVVRHYEGDLLLQFLVDGELAKEEAVALSAGHL